MKMTRRRFLENSITTLVLVPLVGCGSDDSSPMGGGGGGSNSCSGVTSTGSNSSGHIHTVCVPDADLSTPPSSGGTYVTSADAGHTHAVTLSQSQLQSVAGNGSVTVTSTNSSGHTHSFIVKKA